MNDDRIAQRLFALQRKVVIVTGAAGGIGRGVAELFAQFGAVVVVADRNADGAAEVASAIGGTPVVFDQADPASIEAMVAAVTSRFGKLDVMINGAAAFGFQTLEDLNAHHWDRIQSVNLRGTALCCKAGIAAMIDNGGGAIVNISSIASKRTVLFDNFAYGASKAGINALTQAIALQYADRNIRANVVLPGAIHIDAPDPAVADYPMKGPMVEGQRIPLTGEAGQPRDIAAACLYLGSDAARYVTGQILAVDGGITVS